MKPFLRKIKRIVSQMGETVLPATPKDYEQQIFSKFVKHGNVVFDIGANVGHVANYLAKLTGTSGKVLAFEPVLETYQVLAQNVARYAIGKARVVPFNHGFSNATGFCQITIPNDTHELASMAPSQNWIALQSTNLSSVRSCSFFSLDEFLQDPSITLPDFIKIDVEGAEKLVLDGAKGMLSSRRKSVLFIELFAPWERAFGYGPWEPLKELVSAGYVIFFACPQGLIEHSPTERQPTPEQYRHGYNILAIPETRTDLIKIANTLSPKSGMKFFPMPAPPLPNE